MKTIAFKNIKSIINRFKKQKSWNKPLLIWFESNTSLDIIKAQLTKNISTTSIYESDISAAKSSFVYPMNYVNKKTKLLLYHRYLLQLEENALTYCKTLQKKAKKPLIGLVNTYELKNIADIKLYENDFECYICEDPFEHIRQMCSSIITDELNKECELGNVAYKNHRELIKKLFTADVEYSKATIYRRLVVIDSLYSTNASYSYFSFEEMVEKIWALGDTEKAAKDYFYALVNNGCDKQELFLSPYGIYKNLSPGSKQMSLLSKYAYYTLLVDKENYPLGFPIYDSLAKISYKDIAKALGLPKHSKKLNGSIEEYIEVLHVMRKLVLGNHQQLFNGYQQFDILDAYLWRMGKFSNGNLSLLLDQDDYKLFIKNICLEEHVKEDDKKYKLRIKKLVEHKYSVKIAENNIFNLCVVTILRNSNANPFAGLSNDRYLNILLTHWKKYFS